MPEYQGIFGEAYILDWRAKTSAWKISANLRVYCDCATAPFVGPLNPDHPDVIDGSCPDCNKLWCMRCGDPLGFDWGISVHAGATYCKDTWAIEEAARQQHYQGLQGRDHQLCPRCKVYTEVRDEESHAECGACHAAFCFTCGLYQEGEKIPLWLAQNHCGCSGAESSVDSQEQAEETPR